jgi:hypothetical protein
MNYEKDGAPRFRRVARPAAVLLAGFLIAASPLAFGVGAASAAPGDASVTVIHGIPNTPVDVYVDDATAAGAPAIANFQPGTVTGPIALTPGAHQVTIFATGTKTKPVIDKSETLAANANVSLIANLDASGAPVLSAFVNDMSLILAGQARLVARHTAAAPSVDIRANKVVVFSGLTNGQQVTAQLAPGTVSADVVLAGTPTVVIGPVPLTLTAGTETIVYAIGSATGDPGTLGLVVQTITGLAAAPVAPAPVASASAAPVASGAGVNTSGSVQSDASAAPWLAGGAGLAGAVIAVFAIALYRRQRQSA